MSEQTDYINTVFLNKSQIVSIKIVHPISCVIGWNLQQTKEALDVFSDEIEGARAGTVLRSVLSHLLNPNLENLQILINYEIMYQDIDPRQYDLKSILDVLTPVSEKDIHAIFKERAGDGLYQVLHKS